MQIVLRHVTYIVGKQDPSGEFAYSPSDILHFVGCKDAVVIQGNGAVLRCAPALRYGGFNRSGNPRPDLRSNLDPKTAPFPIPP